MASTPNSTGGIDPLLDREDPRAMAMSAEEQWDKVSYLLGLPRMNALPANARAVAQTIADRIADIRGTGVLGGLVFRLEQEHNAELAASAAVLNGLPGAPPTNANVAIADAWLKVIYRNVTEQDLRLMLENIRGETIQVDRAIPGEWTRTSIGGGNDVIVDLNHPAWRTGNEAAIRARLLNRPPVDVGVTVLGATPPTTLTDTMITQIFNSRNDVQLTPNDTSVVQNSTLSEAIARRAPIDQLFSGAADARELMLAMATIQRDPTTIAAMSVNQAGTLQNQRRMLDRERSLSDSLSRLETLKAPTRDRATIMADIATLRAATAPTGTRDSGWATLQRERERVVEQELENLDAVIDNANQVVSSLAAIESMHALLTAGPTNDLEDLRRCLNATRTNVDPGLMITNGFNPKRIAQLVRRVFNTTPPAANERRNVILGTVADYDAQLAENSKRLTEAQGETGQNGSAACWAVIRRGLEHQGLAGKQLEDTIGYMRSRMQGTPEVLRDLDVLAAAAYPAGPTAEEEQEMRDEWNKKHSVASATRLWMAQYDYASRYRDNLFTARNIGIGLQENPLALRRGLPDLMHAYFRAKHFMELPEDDPNHLPNTNDVITFMRRLHTAILRRAQESMHRAEIQQLKALGMNIDVETVAGMTMSQRVQAVQDLLRGGSSSYESHFKTQLEAIAKRANKELIDTKKDKQEWYSMLSGKPSSAAGYLVPLTWPGAIVRGIGAVGGTNAAGKVGKRFAGAIPSAAGGAGIGAAVGTFMIPIPGVGTAIGAGIGAAGGLVYRMFKPASSDKS